MSTRGAVTCTGVNLRLSRELLAAHGVRPESALLVCKPYPVEQDVPADVKGDYQRLIRRGFTSRIVS